MTAALAVALPDTTAMVANAEYTLAIPENFVVGNDDEYHAAAAKLKIVKSFADQWEAERKALKEPILEAGRKIDAKYKEASERLATYERRIKGALTTYHDEQERKRKEAERIAAEAARKERERLEAEAQRAREEADRKARELAEKAAAERAAGNDAAAAKLEAKAETVVEKAEAKAEQKIAAAASVPFVAPITQGPPKVAGLKYTQKWFAVVTNPAIVPREYLLVDEDKLNKIAAALKSASTIPGVEFRSQTVPASARR